MTESHHQQHNHQHDNSNGAAASGSQLSDGLKKFLVGLASAVGKLTALMHDQKKAIEDIKKAAAPPTKDATPAKDAAPAAKSGAK